MHLLEPSRAVAADTMSVTPRTSRTRAEPSERSAIWKGTRSLDGITDVQSCIVRAAAAATPPQPTHSLACGALTRLTMAQYVTVGVATTDSQAGCNATVPPSVTVNSEIISSCPSVAQVLSVAVNFRSDSRSFEISCLPFMRSCSPSVPGMVVSFPPSITVHQIAVAPFGCVEVCRTTLGNECRQEVRRAASEGELPSLETHEWMVSVGRSNSGFAHRHDEAKHGARPSVASLL